MAIDHCCEGRVEQVNESGQVYYMEPGNLFIDRRVHSRIAEQGRYEELMQKNGIYRRFVDARALAGGWKL